MYANEPEIGEAIADGEVRRDELWVTSKLWFNSHGRDNVEPALRQTLQDLGLEWLNLYLIHWPVPIQPGVAFPQSAADLLPPEELPSAPPGRAWRPPWRRG